MLSRSFRRTVVTALAVALTGAFITGAARAELRRLDTQLDGFCTVKCRNDIEHALFPFADEYEDLSVSAENHRVTFVPKKDSRVQLWDIIRQLRNAERIPIRTTVLAVGIIDDYVVSLAPRARPFTRKAFFVGENGLRFLIDERTGFDEALDASDQGTKPVAIFGEVIAWDEYHLPILVIKQAKPADAEWTDAELESLLAPNES